MACMPGCCASSNGVHARMLCNAGELGGLSESLDYTASANLFLRTTHDGHAGIYAWLKELWGILTVVNVLLIGAGMQAFTTVADHNSPDPVLTSLWAVTIAANCVALALCSTLYGYLVTEPLTPGAISRFLESHGNLIAAPELASFVGIAAFFVAVAAHVFVALYSGKGHLAAGVCFLIVIVGALGFSVCVGLRAKALHAQRLSDAAGPVLKKSDEGGGGNGAGRNPPAGPNVIPNI